MIELWQDWWCHGFENSVKQYWFLWDFFYKLQHQNEWNSSLKSTFFGEIVKYLCFLFVVRLNCTLFWKWRIWILMRWWLVEFCNILKWNDLQLNKMHFNLLMMICQQANLKISKLFHNNLFDKKKCWVLGVQLVLSTFVNQAEKTTTAFN